MEVLAKGPYFYPEKIFRSPGRSVSCEILFKANEQSMLKYTRLANNSAYESFRYYLFDDG